MARKYTITLGTELDREGNTVVDLRTNLDWIENVIITMFGGLSQSWVVGAWKNEAGEIVRERSIVYTIVDTGEEPHTATARAIARSAKSALNQESVLFTSEEVHAEFV